jgi:hypothetical protein
MPSNPLDSLQWVDEETGLGDFRGREGDYKRFGTNYRVFEQASRRYPPVRCVEREVL